MNFVALSVKLKVAVIQFDLTMIDAYGNGIGIFTAGKIRIAKRRCKYVHYVLYCICDVLLMSFLLVLSYRL